MGSHPVVDSNPRWRNRGRAIVVRLAGAGACYGGRGREAYRVNREACRGALPIDRDFAQDFIGLEQRGGRRARGWWGAAREAGFVKRIS